MASVTRTAVKSLQGGVGYELAGAEAWAPEAVAVSWDGTSAAGSFVVAVSFYNDGGALIDRAWPDGVTSSPGATGRTFFRPFRRGGGDSTSSTGSPVLELKVFPEWGTVVTGDSKLVALISTDMGGLALSTVAAFVSTAASGGTTTVQIRNVTQAADMLSTPLTIDAGEFTSYTAAVPPVVNAGTATVAAGDLIAVDVDVAGTDTRGLGVVLGFA